MVYLDGRLIKAPVHQSYLVKVANPSSDIVESYIDKLYYKDGIVVADSDNSIVEKLSIYAESGFFYLQLMDNRSEWGVREYINPKIDLRDNNIISVGEFNCTRATTTSNISLVVKIVNEFVNTNDVSLDLMPM